MRHPDRRGTDDRQRHHGVGINLNYAKYASSHINMRNTPDVIGRGNGSAPYFRSCPTPLPGEARVKSRWRLLPKKVHHNGLNYKQYEGCEPFFWMNTLYMEIDTSIPSALAPSSVHSRTKNRLEHIGESFDGCFYSVFPTPWGISHNTFYKM